MTFRAATDADVPQIDTFLQQHLTTSVFLLSNLRRFGPKGGDHQFAMRFWITGDPISGVIAQSTKGAIFAQWPNARNWREAVQVLPDPITGALGQAGQVDALLRAAGLRDVPMLLDTDETLMSLDLLDMVDQHGVETLHPINKDTRNVVTDWRADATITTLGEPKDSAPARAEAEIAAYIAADTHRVLLGGDGTPVSMTGFNAILDDLVQIGGVYTPPELRARGYARRAVSLHLQEALAKGATRAILFSQNPWAIAAYRAIGFTPIGRFALITFQQGHRPR